MIELDAERKLMPVGTHGYVIGIATGYLLNGATGVAVGALIVAGLMYLLNIIVMVAVR